MLILRAESARNAAKNAAHKEAENVRKLRVIDVLHRYGCRQKLTVKRGFGELLTAGVESLVSTQVLAEAAELSESEVEDKVCVFVRKKRRKCA